ncbi:MAG: hypothetical protein AAF596_11375, partial [Planctomycetota bacterium]
VLRWRLSTTADGVLDSTDLFTIFAPDGSAGNGLHHQSLYLERYLGAPLAAGDFDRDGVAAAGDFDAWAAAFGSTSLYAGSGADANHDHAVSAADYAVWRDAIAVPAVSVAVALPEPGGLAACLLSVAAISVPRWRRSAAIAPRQATLTLGG